MTITIILAQLNFTVGALAENSQKILTAMHTAHAQNANIIVFPELALSGYPPEDLLLRHDFLTQIKQHLYLLQQAMPENLLAIIGYPEIDTHHVYNSAIVFTREHIVVNYRKQYLPNYGVFDEKRYFTPGTQTALFEYQGIHFGLTICEDIWHAPPIKAAKQAGAQILITLNASPFHQNKFAERQHILAQRLQQTELPILYVNHCCGQDDLIFDGCSLAINAQNEIMAQAPFAQETLLPVKISNSAQLQPTIITPLPSEEEQLYRALVLGVRDYVQKNHFQRVIVGFSGGIDSALTLAIATDALGKENVLPILLPARYTSALSLQAAYQQLTYLQLNAQEISIEPAFQAFLQSLQLSPHNPPSNLTTQNLQARCRAVILMAVANQQNALLLNTSNKSELAVGYGTLYGDMCGAYAVLKDVWKTMVYRLAHYRNQHQNIIPLDIIQRPPSAELAPNQLDTDSLPPYDILDAILEKYIEHDLSAEEIIAQGAEATTVHRVIRLVNLNEYKRKQSPPGPRITPRAFTRERRYPLTNGFLSSPA